jgi:hypothetical protein
VTDQFQHVMVLTSIIIGLGITHLLLGISAAIDRMSEQRERARVSWVFWVWVAYVFLWMVQFWWWEYRLLELLQAWSLWNYFLVISYAVVLFLLAAILVPRKWDEVDDLDQYFLSKRRWFYSLLLLASAIDIMDSYMKGGWSYVQGTGFLTWGQNLAWVPASIIGFRSANIRVHSTLAIVFLIWQIVIGFDVFLLLKDLN